MAKHPFESCIDSLDVSNGGYSFFSLPKLEALHGMRVSRLPACLRIVLESILRHADGKRISEEDVKTLCRWEAQGPRTAEVPFVVARVLLQDFTGVPLVVDLAAMRSAAKNRGYDPELVQPLVPVDLVVDHSVQVDYARRKDALDLNMKMEFERNKPRYEFLKWGMHAFSDFSITPPGIGIVHQVNLEHLARGVLVKDDVCYPDTLVGTDSHTTMINGLGVVGWGVGGIEAEAGMLGQPIYILTPDVVGVELTGSLREGVTATDLVLTVTEMLRHQNVVGKFVEFHGSGAVSLPLAERATLANMAPEYGATMGYFPIDEENCRYLTQTGRPEEHVELYRSYYRAQQLFGMPEAGQCDYTETLKLDLATVEPSVAGPKRPQDRIALGELKEGFEAMMSAPSPKGYGKSDRKTRPGGRSNGTLHHGDALIAAITSCTNTSNPSVMIAAGLVAQKAAARGLSVQPHVKTSLAPGSRVVTEYLEETGLLEPLEQLGFALVGYGCTTCIGNSGPLDAAIEKQVTENDLICASVLSGNRNFEARIHPAIKANFLMSPPLVVAFALAGRIDIDLDEEPLGHDKGGEPVMLRDVWPTLEEVAQLVAKARSPETCQKLYANVSAGSTLWQDIDAPQGSVYTWDETSTYIQEPPYFDEFELSPKPVHDVRGSRALAIFGDSVTTDHISPAGSIKPDSPAGTYLQSEGVSPPQFNSYGARRGNHEVMVRGTFANVRIKNLLVPGVEGGVTVHQPSGEQTSIYEAAQRYAGDKVPLMVFGGKEYGTGSSRDWAAKGTQLLGVRAVVAKSFERIHRSNLLGMGVLPCQFEEGEGPEELSIDGSETFDLLGLEEELKPQKKLKLIVHRSGGESLEATVTARVDTPVEVDYFLHGGIMPYVLRQLIRRGQS